MVIALAQEDESCSQVYRVNVKDLTSDEIFFKTVTADDPDGAVSRTIDMVTQGLKDPEDFWNSYTITSITKECEGG